MFSRSIVFTFSFLLVLLNGSSLGLTSSTPKSLSNNDPSAHASPQLTFLESRPNSVVVELSANEGRKMSITSMSIRCIDGPAFQSFLALSNETGNDWTYEIKETWTNCQRVTNWTALDQQSVIQLSNSDPLKAIYEVIKLDLDTTYEIRYDGWQWLSNESSIPISITTIAYTESTSPPGWAGSATFFVEDVNSTSRVLQVIWPKIDGYGLFVEIFKRDRLISERAMNCSAQSLGPLEISMEFHLFRFSRIFRNGTRGTHYSFMGVPEPSRVLSLSSWSPRYSWFHNWTGDQDCTIEWDVPQNTFGNIRYTIVYISQISVSGKFEEPIYFVPLQREHICKFRIKGPAPAVLGMVIESSGSNSGLKIVGVHASNINETMESCRTSMSVAKYPTRANFSRRKKSPDGG